MKTKKYFTHYEKTILENIDLEAYDINTSNMNDFDKVCEVYTIFTKEFVHRNNKHIAQNKLFAEWLQGLPSVLTVPFYNHAILDNAKNEGFNLMTEQAEDNFLNMYWVNLANAFFTLYENL